MSKRIVAAQALLLVYTVTSVVGEGLTQETPKFEDVSVPILGTCKDDVDCSLGFRCEPLFKACIRLDSGALRREQPLLSPGALAFVVPLFFLLVCLATCIPAATCVNLISALWRAGRQHGFLNLPSMMDEDHGGSLCNVCCTGGIVAVTATVWFVAAVSGAEGSVFLPTEMGSGANCSWLTDPRCGAYNCDMRVGACFTKCTANEMCSLGMECDEGSGSCGVLASQRSGPGIAQLWMPGWLVGWVAPLAAIGFAVGGLGAYIYANRNGPLPPSGAVQVGAVATTLLCAAIPVVIVVGVLAHKSTPVSGGLAADGPVCYGHGICAPYFCDLGRHGGGHASAGSGGGNVTGTCLRSCASDIDCMGDYACSDKGKCEYPTKIRRYTPLGMLWVTLMFAASSALCAAGTCESGMENTKPPAAYFLSSCSCAVIVTLTCALLVFYFSHKPAFPPGDLDSKSRCTGVTAPVCAPFLCNPTEGKCITECRTATDCATGASCHKNKCDYTKPPAHIMPQWKAWAIGLSAALLTVACVWPTWRVCNNQPNYITVIESDDERMGATMCLGLTVTLCAAVIVCVTVSFSLTSRVSPNSRSGGGRASSRRAAAGGGVAGGVSDGLSGGGARWRGSGLDGAAGVAGRNHGSDNFDKRRHGINHNGINGYHNGHNGVNGNNNVVASNLGLLEHKGGGAGVTTNVSTRSDTKSSSDGGSKCNGAFDPTCYPFECDFSNGVCFTTCGSDTACAGENTFCHKPSSTCKYAIPKKPLPTRTLTAATAAALIFVGTVAGLCLWANLLICNPTEDTYSIMCECYMIVAIAVAFAFTYSIVIVYFPLNYAVVPVFPKARGSGRECFVLDAVACHPYFCDVGEEACYTSCKDSAECADSYSCDADTGTCRYDAAVVGLGNRVAVAVALSMPVILCGIWHFPKLAGRPKRLRREAMAREEEELSALRQRASDTPKVVLDIEPASPAVAASSIPTPADYTSERGRRARADLAARLFLSHSPRSVDTRLELSDDEPQAVTLVNGGGGAGGGDGGSGSGDSGGDGKKVRDADHDGRGDGTPTHSNGNSSGSALAAGVGGDRYEIDGVDGLAAIPQPMGGSPTVRASGSSGRGPSVGALAVSSLRDGNSSEGESGDGGGGAAAAVAVGDRISTTIDSVFSASSATLDAAEAGGGDGDGDAADDVSSSDSIANFSLTDSSRVASREAVTAGAAFTRSQDSIGFGQLDRGQTGRRRGGSDVHRRRGGEGSSGRAQREGGTRSSSGSVGTEDSVPVSGLSSSEAVDDESSLSNTALLARRRRGRGDGESGGDAGGAGGAGGDGEGSVASRDVVVPLIDIKQPSSGWARVQPDCAICFAAPATVTLVNEVCDHGFCDDCTAQCLDTILGANQFPAMCPGCRAEATRSPDEQQLENTTIPAGTVESLVRRGILSVAFGRRFVNSQIMRAFSVGELCVCPACGVMAVQRDWTAKGVDDNPNVTRVSCGNCNMEICGRCQNLWMGHDGISCAEYGARMCVDPETEALMESTFKKCPGCRTPFVHYRYHSCHHIKPVTGCPCCGLHFCCVCLGPWPCLSVDHGGNCSDKCDCPVCPDCKLNSPCPSCPGRCPACLGHAR